MFLTYFSVNNKEVNMFLLFIIYPISSMDSTFLVPYLCDLFTHLVTLAVGDLGPRQSKVASLPALQEFPATFLFPQLPL